MLVLSRKPNESIIIGSDIEIKVLEIKNGIVKLGVAAPKKVAVHRKEIFEDIKTQNEKAARLLPNFDLKQILHQVDKAIAEDLDGKLN